MGFKQQYHEWNEQKEYLNNQCLDYRGKLQFDIVAHDEQRGNEASGIPGKVCGNRLSGNEQAKGEQQGRKD